MDTHKHPHREGGGEKKEEEEKNLSQDGERAHSIQSKQHKWKKLRDEKWVGTRQGANIVTKLSAKAQHELQLLEQRE